MGTALPVAFSLLEFLTRHVLMVSWKLMELTVEVSDIDDILIGE